MSKHSKLYDRAGLWQTRALQALAKRDHNHSGRLRTKSLQLAAHTKHEEEKIIEKKHRPYN